MPVGKTGTTSEYAYSLSDYDGVYYGPIHDEIGVFPITASQPSRNLPSRSGRTIASVELTPCVPSHFSVVHDMDVEASWTALRSGSTTATRDRFSADPSIDLATYGTPGSVRRSVEDVNWLYPLAPSFLTRLYTGTLSGARAADVIMHGASTHYTEYIPDVAGGVYTPALVLYDDIDPNVFLIGPDVYRFVGRSNIMGRGEVEPSWPWTNTATYNLGGEDPVVGVVLKITLLDYEIDPEWPHGSVSNVSVHLGGSSSPYARLYCHAAAEKFGRVAYATLPLGNNIPYLLVDNSGLLWSDLRIEIYSSYQPPVSPFWTGFQRTLEIL